MLDVLNEIGDPIATVILVILVVGAIAGALGGVTGLFEWTHDRLRARSQRELTRSRATEDLKAQLHEISREEAAQYEVVDQELLARNVYRSGMRSARYVEIAESHDRRRQWAVTEWRRQLENTGLGNPPEPPAASKTQPTRFEGNGVTFSRATGAADPGFCKCGRLAYMVSTGRDGYISWWCPEHEYAIS